VHLCNPSTQEAEVGGWRVWVSLGYKASSCLRGGGQLPLNVFASFSGDGEMFKVESFKACENLTVGRALNERSKIKKK
jgi:hypothetical protein